MEIEVVSKKVFVLCICASIALLATTTIISFSDTSYAYICNEKDRLDIYIRQDGNDAIVKPQDIKNTLTCLGRGMAFYDRTIEHIIDPSNSAVIEKLSTRYLLSDYIEADGETYYCIRDARNHLVIQKNIEVNELQGALKICNPTSIILAGKYRDNRIFKAIESRGYEMTFIENGSYKKLLL